jgi:hypothetical protein
MRSGPSRGRFRFRGTGKRGWTADRFLVRAFVRLDRPELALCTFRAERERLGLILRLLAPVKRAPATSLLVGRASALSAAEVEGWRHGVLRVGAHVEVVSAACAAN